MSHLIIEQGKNVGTEVAVPETGMKFGRSPANDLVLEDDAVMLFHGRFFFKSDGALWVTDFGAGEKTTVGGEAIDEHPLKMGDLVEVGNTAFRIINTTLHSDPSPVTVVEPEELKPDATHDHSIDLGFNRPSPRKVKPAVGSKPPAKSKLINRLVIVLAMLVVVVVAVLVFNSLSNKLGGAGGGGPQKGQLTLTYERVEGDDSNIFRYYLELDVKGRLSISVDDLKNKRHIQKTEAVPASAVQQLAKNIDNSGFFRLDTDFAGVAEGQYDLYDLTVQYNSRFHHIKVLNRTAPPEIRNAVDSIEDFALTELGIPATLFRDPEELLREAQHAFEVGQTRYAERDVRNANLAAAIGLFEETMLYLNTFEPKPELFEQADRLLEQAKAEQDRRYEDYMFNVDNHMQLRQWDEAQRYLRILIELIPDRDDERYDEIERKLNNVEQRLR